MAAIHYSIEKIVAEEDERARAAGVTLTDSPVISVLTKVIQAAKGEPPKLSYGDTGRDRYLRALHDRLVAQREVAELEITQPDGTTTCLPLSSAMWITCLRDIADSAKMRKGPMPGSRGYLDFLRDFIKNLDAKLYPKK